MTSKYEGLVESLKNKNSSGISEIYKKLVTKIKKNRTGDIKLLSDITACVRRDLVTKDVESADAAFKFLSHFSKVAASQLCSDDETALMPMFVEALLSTATVDCIREYFPVVFSNIPIEDFVTLSYQTVCQDKKNLSFVVKDEMLKMVSKLSVDQENATPNFSKCYPRMLQILLVFTVDDEDMIRKCAIRAATDYIQAHPIQPTEIAQIISRLKSLICPKLNGLLKKNVNCLQEILDDQVPLYLKVIGINMRRSSSLTNTLLKIIEQGFRDPNVKSASFKTWQLLIDELSVDLELLASQRYMNLVMQPLTTMQTSESLNILRIKTLWGLAQKLKNKLSTLFPTVCLPILHCCLGNLDASRKSLNDSAASIKASRKSSFYTALQATGYRATPKKASKSSQLHDIGVQVLMRLLTYSDEEDPIETGTFTITKLENNLLATPAIFNSYGLVFIAAVEEVLCNKTDISSDLAITLWNRLHYQVKTLLELNLQKKKREPEMFNALMLTFRNILATSSLSCKVTFTMLKSFLVFPTSILSSTFYGGTSKGVHGFPALTLLQLLFSDRLVLEQSSHGSLDILTCACDLVAIGFSSIIGVLPYCSSVLDILVSFARRCLIGKEEDSSTVDHCVDIMFKLWEKIGAGLKDHIEKTQEVNQGDNLDHDFSALYYFLLFPVHVKTFKTRYIDMWDRVYEEFFKGSSFVRACRPNEICAHISSKILKQVNSNWSNSVLEFVGHICNTMAAKSQYNHGGFSKPRLSRYDSSGMSPKSPVACELELEVHKNLADLCLVVKKLFAISGENSVPHLRLCDASMKCLAHLFSSIYYSGDIKILFQAFVPSLTSVVSNHHDNVKMFCERLQTIFHAVENVYRSCVVENNMVVFQKDFHLLICECVQSESSKTRNIAVELWQNVVVNSQQHSAICESMTGESKSHLFPVYKIMGWSCPWKDVELPATLELPEYGEDTQSSDMVTVGYGAFGSPNKSNRLSSPRKTPLRAVSSPIKSVATPAVKRKLDATMDDVSYVNCVSPFTKPRTPLTERQKEKLREREYIPTMYNELDEKQEKDIEIDTQQDLDMDKRPGNSGEDVIESSQSQESPKKKMKIHVGEKKICESTATSTKSGDELCNSRTLNFRPTAVSHASDSGYTSKENPPMPSVSESFDGVDDQKRDANSTYDCDQSYEYVEMHDASTNRTQIGKNITFNDDDKDLGVTPLDESYECVVMVDMSVNAGNFTNASLSSQHSRDITVDKKDDVSEDCNTNSAANVSRNKKRSKGRPRKKRRKQASLLDDTTVTSHETSIADCQDLNSSTCNQDSVSSQPNDLKSSKKMKAANVQPEREDSAVDAGTAEQPVLRRSQRSKKNNSQQSDDSDGTTSPQDIDTTESATNKGVKAQDASVDSGVDTEKSTSAVQIEPVSYVETEDDYMDGTGEDVGSDDDQKGNDTTLYEYVEVADTSCCNVTHQRNSAAHDESPTSKIFSNDNIKSKRVVETDISTATSQSEVKCSVTPGTAGPICTANSTFDVDVVSTSDRPTCSANSTFVVEPEGEGSDVPVSNGSNCSANSIFTIEPNSDEDDFIDARSSLGLCSSINTAASSTVNHSDVRIADDPNFIENNISVIQVPASNDTKEAAALSERDASGEKTTDKNSDDTSVPYVTANLNIKGDATVSKISSSSAGDSLPLDADYQTSPVSSKPTSMVDMNPSTVSPNARGILKRRSIVADSPAASPSNKRVSFAEPVSVSGAACSSTGEGYDILQSPRAFHYRGKNMPKVNRRLSLQSERIRYPHENKVAMSPLSLRSVRVAEAIANIRAKDSNSSRLQFNRSNTDDTIDFSKLSVGDLQNPEFLRSLEPGQGLKLFRIINSIQLDLVTNVLGT